MKKFDSDHGSEKGTLVSKGGGLPDFVLPHTTPEVRGIDLTHVLHTTDVEGGLSAAKGGGKPGGGGGGGGTSFPDYVSGPTNTASGFNITLHFTGDGWTQPLVEMFKRAADFYTSLIVGDLPSVKVIGSGKPTTVDDIVINAEISAIDGSGGVLGQAGPTAVRTDGSLPATAIMQFDVADVNDFNAQGLFDDIVFHEMGHSLGFGSIWSMLGLVNGSGFFTGAEAMSQSLIEYGTSQIWVEQEGGGGTAGSHWDEETYDNEIMTGYINDANYLSHMSAGSFEDLGYQLANNYQAVADSFIV